MDRWNGKVVTQGAGFLVSLALLAVLELYVFPTDWSWRAWVIFFAFAFGFVELIRAAVDVRSDEQSSSTASSAVVGAALLLVAVYLARQEDSGWRMILAAPVLVLGGWAVGHLFPDEDELEEAEEPDSEQRVQEDEELLRSPRVF